MVAPRNCLASLQNQQMSRNRSNLVHRYRSSCNIQGNIISYPEISAAALLVYGANYEQPRASCGLGGAVELRVPIGIFFFAFSQVTAILSSARESLLAILCRCARFPVSIQTESIMSSAEDEFNEHDVGSLAQGSKKRRVQRACDICRRKKSKLAPSWMFQAQQLIFGV
jgi:hypothetical protein